MPGTAARHSTASFAGRALRLPEFYLERDQGRLTIRPSVWLTTLGNHAIRIDYALDGALPQDLYELINLGDPEYGDLEALGRPLTCHVRGADRETLTWKNLVDLVESILESLETLLRAEGHQNATAAYSRGTGRSILQITDCTAYDPRTGHAVSLNAVSELDDLVGTPLLSQPIDTGTYAVAQWALYETGRVRQIQFPAAAPSLVNISENTTVIASLSQPSWALDIVADMTSFAVMLSGLLEAWHQELAVFHAHSRDQLTRLRKQLDGSDDRPLTAAEIGNIREDLNRSHFAIREFMAGCRATMLFVESTSLVHSPLLRSLLDQILEGIGYHREIARFVAAGEGYLDAQLNSVMEAIQQRAVSVELVAQRHRARQARLLMEALLAGVAVAGISGVASLLQAGYGLGGGLSLVLAMVSVGIAAIVGYVTFRVSRMSDA